MFNTGILTAFSRLMVNNVLAPTRSISTCSPLNVNVTNVLLGEPLKKKKKVDVGLVRAREERKKKKLLKSIKRLEKHAQQLKPISDIDIPLHLEDDFEFRKREVEPLTPEELQEHRQLFREWNWYKTDEFKKTQKHVLHCMKQQDKALEELRKLSEELYLEAIAIDPDFLPFSTKGPVHTPPIENYEAPDGEYIDITKKYEGET